MEKYERMQMAYNYLKSHNIIRTRGEVADRMHIDGSNLSKAFKNDPRYLTDSFVLRFNAAFDNMFSHDWLMEGTGEMIIKKTATITNNGGAPYYNIDFDTLPSNINSIREDSYICMRMADSADFWCNMRGDSMFPVLNNGDIIALKEIRDLSLVSLGEIYGVILSNGLRIVRRLCASSSIDTLILAPVNTGLGFAPQEINKDYISKVFAVLAAARKL